MNDAEIEITDCDYSYIEDGLVWFSAFDISARCRRDFVIGNAY